MDPEMLEKARHWLKRWVGSWRVTNTFCDGTVATGSFVVHSALNSQLLIGNYATSKGPDRFEGLWIRAFDPRHGVFKYWWFDTLIPGQVEEAEGTLADNVIIFEGTRRKERKVRLVERWVDSDEVHQHIELDRGNGFEPVFQIAYRREE